MHDRQSPQSMRHGKDVRLQIPRYLLLRAALPLVPLDSGVKVFILEYTNDGVKVWMLEYCDNRVRILMLEYNDDCSITVWKLE